MSADDAALLGLALAVALANLPFLFDWRRGGALPARLLGWLLLYGAWMALCALLESRFGKLPARDWSLWAVSAAFFAVLAFPGMTWRYLWHARKQS